MLARIPVAGALLVGSLVTGSVVWTRSETNRLPSGMVTPSASPTGSAVKPSEPPSPHPDQPASLSDESPIEPLDRLIQPRFRSTDKDFGIARIPMTHLGVRGFWYDPEDAAEREVRDRLHSGGWEVAFYLGGRRILEEMPPGGAPYRTSSLDDESRRMIEEPVHLTTSANDLPRPRDLLEHGRKAIAAFATADFYKGSLGRWSIDARPVRAHEQGCLSCHNAQERKRPIVRDGKPLEPLRLGNAVGTVIYVYARRPDGDRSGAGAGRIDPRGSGTDETPAPPPVPAPPAVNATVK
jgi:hypothetical protein